MVLEGLNGMKVWESRVGGGPRSERNSALRSGGPGLLELQLRVLPAAAHSGRAAEPSSPLATGLLAGLHDHRKDGLLSLASRV